MCGIDYVHRVGVVVALFLSLFRIQYENIKRIYRHIEDMPGHVPTIIREHFVLEPNLAEYGCPLLLFI